MPALRRAFFDSKSGTRARAFEKTLSKPSQNSYTCDKGLCACCIYFTYGDFMKKILLPVLFLLVFTVACHQEKEVPYNRDFHADTYERNFRSNVFASCLNEGKPYSTYSLARINRKPTDCDPRFKVTFLNGPCEGKTIFTTDVIEKTSPVSGGQLRKGEVVLRNFHNPRKLNKDTAALDHWNKAVVYDTSRMDKGVVELEFPRDKNDFMAAREFIFLHNVRYIQKPEQKDPRIWL